MKIEFKDKSYEFRPWKPTIGAVFERDFSFDCETTLIPDDRPWETPPFVIGAAFDGERGFFVTREAAADFFKAHQRNVVAFHNAPFDLAVLQLLLKRAGQDVYSRVDKDLIWDTQLLHRLLVLGTEGHTASGKDKSTLETCTELYLDAKLPKDIRDSSGKPVRLSYGQFLNRPPDEIEQVYLEYLAKDVIVTFRLFQVLARKLKSLLEGGSGVWGFKSRAWLRQQVDRWGPQTHNIQLRAAIVLREITANGLRLDKGRREELEAALKQSQASLLDELRGYGFLPGKGSQKALQSILKRLDRELRHVQFARTATGKYSASREVLQDLQGTVPFVDVYLKYQTTTKLLNSFVSKLAKGVVHPSFNVLARTGRTTSFGEINAQNLPRDDAVRSCFVPSPGHVFIDADYATIELVALAQACMAQFRLNSKMAEAINGGKDLHRVVAARVVGKSENEVTKGERAKAKPINFGKPGGMGDATMRQYAKASYGIGMSDEEVSEITGAWFALFPEMEQFLSDVIDVPLVLAQRCDLTPLTHSRHTGDRRFYDHPDNHGLENQPHHILGMMCLKVLGHDRPCTRAGEPYSTGDVDFFWTQAQLLVQDVCKVVREDLSARRPSKQLQRAVAGAVGRTGVFTLTGRLRANASYCARHNTIFQGLAADGAKIALWMLWRAGYRIVNFVHDQVLAEIPESADLKGHAEQIRAIMIDGMKFVIPDVGVDVSYACSRRWHKGAEALYDEQGILLPWEPSDPESDKSIIVVADPC